MVSSDCAVKSEFVSTGSHCCSSHLSKCSSELAVVFELRCRSNDAVFLKMLSVRMALSARIVLIAVLGAALI